MADVLRFPTSDKSAIMAGYRKLASEPPSLDDLVRDLGNPEDWLDAANLHLRNAVFGRTAGSAEVSVAALHLVLDHLERLESGEETPRGGPA